MVKIMVPNPNKHGMIWGYQYFWKHPFSVLAAFLWLFMLEGSFTKSGLFFGGGGGGGKIDRKIRITTSHFGE